MEEVKQKMIKEIVKGEIRDNFIYVKRFGLWLEYWKHSKLPVHLLTTKNRYGDPFVFSRETRSRIFNILYNVVNTENDVLISFDNDSEQELFSLFVANKKLLG